MIPVPGPVPFGDSLDRARIARFADAIKRRTGVDTAIDLHFNRYFFYQGEMDRSRGEPQQCLRPDGTVSVPDIDEVVATINLGRVPRWLKEKWRRHAEWQMQMHKKDQKDSFLEERRDDAIGFVEGRRKQRRSLVVNGTKGA